MEFVEELGSESFVYVMVGEQRFVARASDNVPQRGENVVLTFNPARLTASIRRPASVLRLKKHHGQGVISPPFEVN